jgi:23S rRNA pseudouridine1911/1915/1917 synthase
LVETNDVIEIDVYEEEKSELKPVKKELDVLYEDEYFIILNKDKDVVVHPADSFTGDTLVNYLLGNGVKLANVSEKRPGVVHRLDRFTSGIIVFAKTKESYESMTSMFKNKEIVKKYVALCYNRFKNEKGVVDMPIGRSKKDRKKMTVTSGGKEAITYFSVIENFEKYAFVNLMPKTGRTHQLRVHMAKIGHPIVGDNVYGPEKNEFGVKGQLLHAYSLEFMHPFYKKSVKILAKLPEEFYNILRGLGYEFKQGIF